MSNSSALENSPFKPLPGGKRWYDNDPRAGWAIELILNFPKATQYTLCDELLSLMASLRDARERHEACKSLGREGILALYRSRQKRRAYDHDQHTFQVLSCMSILHPKDQQTMLDHIAQLADCVRQTVEICKNEPARIAEQKIKEVIHLYCNKGNNATRAWLQNLSKSLNRTTLSQPSVSPTPLPVAIPASGSGLHRQRN